MTNKRFKKFVLVSIPLVAVFASLATTSVVASRQPQESHSKEHSISISAKSVRQLKKMFAHNDYTWPETKTNKIPQLVLRSLPDDFALITDVDEKKELFVKSIMPIVLLENRTLREKRSLAKLILQYEALDEESEHENWIRKLALRYKLRFNPLNLTSLKKSMLLKLDEVPVKLVIAQAAIESGWGSSRFALEGNSLFGQWTFSDTNSLIPEFRDEDANHKIKAFPNLRSSIKAYLFNINTNRAYRELRAFRAKARSEGRKPNALELATHLHRYSQRGNDYTKDLKRIIESRLFNKLNAVSLLEPTTESTENFASSTGP